MSEIPDPVQSQYEKWPYPAPYKDLSRVDWKSPHDHVKDLRELFWSMWPGAARNRLDLDILVAGCGTNLAASYAYSYRDARVVGIDISSASLAHEQFLKEKHGLKNLELRQLPLEQCGSLGRQFDFINCSGVLHHLVDPVAGLTALGGVLRQDGVVNVMLYGRHGRYGVYMMQELFHLLNLTPTDAALKTVKETLSLVPVNHQIRPYLKTPDLTSDAGIVDTFLHQRDVAYTARECVEFAQNAGMAFMSWQEPILYHPDAQIPLGTSLREQLDRLGEPDIWAAMELIHGGLTLHAFNVCRKDRDPATYRMQINGPELLGYVPVLRDRLEINGNLAQGSGSLELKPFVRVPLDRQRGAVFSAIDGKRTVAQCMQIASEVPEPIARDLFARLWRLGYILLRTGSSGQS